MGDKIVKMDKEKPYVFKQKITFTKKLKAVILVIVMFVGLLFYVALDNANIYFEDALQFIEVHNSFSYNLFEDNFVIYQEDEHSLCSINVTEPAIILRMDDVRAYSRLTRPLVDEIISRDLSVTLGVIPKNLEKDPKIINYLKEIKTSPFIEIAQHGNYHDESDKNINNESLIEGYEKIQRVLGVLPTTYIPPYNEISSESKGLVSNYFSMISGGQGIIIEEDNIIEIGQTVATYYYTVGEIVPTERVIAKCKESLEKNDVCVINIHPQEYAIDINNPLILDENKFKEFKHLLDELENLNVKFSRFTDVVSCSA